ncbi:hypothetical protein KI387_008832 [Taxus chinensis]|uniref:Uncharacterized protein n=1 Tax=Taxus chinensis TaxID=29808 RepID=A0AA38CVY8_TAXCH|nr:hypothetical protein KI387_008832 [Taxus chinensis]
MEAIARLANQSPKPSRVIRTTINVKHETPVIPNSKYGKPTWPAHLNAFAGNSNLYESLLGSYTNPKALAPGKQVHAHILLTGVHHNTFLRFKLLNMYVMCDSLEDARKLFDKIPKSNHDAFLWNVIIRGYATNGFSEEAVGIFYQMQLAGIQPDNFTFPFVLKACAGVSALQKGMEIHDYVIKRGFEPDVYVGNGLIALYAKCGSVEDAWQVFDQMPERDVVSWNSMIAGYVQNRCCDEALELFDQMELAGPKPNSITVVSILPACADLEALQEGKNIHDYVTRNGLDSQVSVENALIDMYAKCGVVELARQVFDKMSERNIISWNSMIAGCTQAGYSDKAIEMFSHMQQAGIKPDAISIASVLPACTHMGALQQGKEIHNYAIKNGLDSIVFVANSLIDMYSKCGTVGSSRHVFNNLNERNSVSWSVMIAGYAQNSYHEEAVSLFRQMQLVGSKLVSITITNFLPSCAHLASLHLGKEIHCHILRNGFESDIFVENGLIDMYAKCRNLELAYKVFDKMSPKDIISFNSVIAGYAQNSHYTKALELFRQMEQAGMKPDPVTILSILLPCAHLSALRQGKEIHNYIIRHAYELHVFVLNSLLDMYVKCGNIDTAKLLFDRIPQRDVASWNTMIAGYAIQGQSKAALKLFHEMQPSGLKPNHITFIAVLSACSHAGLVEEGWQYFDCMCQSYITPQREHYACMVDLLCRAGLLNEALDFINKMPFEPDPNLLGSLLAACRIHCNIELGERVAEHLFEVDPENTGYYVLMSNIYAASGRWDDVTKVRKLMEERGLKKKPGWSWIEVNSKVHAFHVGDRSHPQSENIYAILKNLSYI